MVFDADVHGRRQRDDGRLLRQHGEHSPDRVPDGDDGRADPFPDGDGGSDRRTLARRDDRGDDARAGRQLAEKIAQAVQQISEIDEAQVVVNNGRALVAVRFDAQYSAGLDDRMKQQITETVQKVDDTLKDVEITDDDTLYGQIKGLGERVANVTGLDELADDFGDLWDRIVGR